MIIVDFKQVLFATFFAAVKQHTNAVIELPVIRTMSLNMLRNIRKKFPDHDVVVASDSVSNWRRDYFPNYKARRRIKRSDSDVDWTSIFESMDVVRQEISENFPYTHIQIEGCEADDIIGTIVHHTKVSPVIIISADKDFKQLQTYSNVTQYDHIKGRWIKAENPYELLHEHILRGDVDDDVPNILSEDDTFVVDGKRQVPLTKKRIEMLQNVQNDENHKYYRNWIRNKTLIDLSMTPEHLRNKIIEAFEKGPMVKDRSKLYGYITKNRLSSLLENINDF